MGQQKRKHKRGVSLKPKQSQPAIGPSSGAWRFPLILAGGLVILGAAVVLLGRMLPGGDARNSNKLPSSAIGNAATSAAQPDGSLHTTPTSTQSSARAIDADDPARDGWDTEAFNLDAGQQLSQLGKLLIDPSPFESVSLQNLIADEFACPSLVPAPLTEVFRDANVAIERFIGPSDANGAEHVGQEGLAAALLDLKALFAGARDLRYKFKVFRVDPEPEFVTTVAYFSISGLTETGMLEQNATWRNRWRKGEPGKLPRLLTIEVVEFEQVRTLTGGKLFADCSQSLLESNDCYATQLLRGTDYWADRIHNKRFLHERAEIGIAVGDANGDGLDDVYICQRAGLPNRLLLQQADGTLRDVSRAAGVDWLHSSRAALFLDLDNDGDQDLVVGMDGGVVVAENTGAGEYVIRLVLDTDNDTQAIAAADYDLDGRVDLYVCAYEPEPWRDGVFDSGLPSGTTSFVYHDANTGAPNQLFRNLIQPGGAWEFEDVTVATGMDVDNRRYSFAAAWEDYDNDGDPDLYIANDYGKSCFFRNDSDENGQRRFTNVAEEIGALNHNTGMSVSWADFDRDGWMDLYVANMWSSAGNRITFQPQFRPDSPESLRTLLQRFAKGNVLFHNRGDGTFRDHTDVAHVAMGRWAFASNFVDINNDGWPDIGIANGFVTNAFDHDL